MLCEYFERERSFASEAKILSLQAQAKAQRNCKEKSQPTTEKANYPKGFPLGAILAPVASVPGSLLFRWNGTCKKMTLVDSNFAIDQRNIKKKTLLFAWLKRCWHFESTRYRRLWEAHSLSSALNEFLAIKKSLETDHSEPLKVHLETPKIEEESASAPKQSVKKRQ